MPNVMHTAGRTDRRPQAMRLEFHNEAAVLSALESIASEYNLTPALRSRLMDLASGLTYREIAIIHAISQNTVKTEVRDLLGALGLRCRHEIDHAVDAASERAEHGDSASELHAFLQLRFE